jgi:DNA repair/transcription protein MET18/MMS19
VIENDLELVTVLVQSARDARQAAEMSNGEDGESLERLNSIYAILCGVLRRYSSKKAEALLEFVREGPALPNQLGSQLAHRTEMLVAPQTFLTKANYAVVKPLWMQKFYFGIVTPMLSRALDSNEDADVRKRYGVAVILMLRHMTFSIYETDADKVLKIAILTSQKPASPIEFLAALDVLQNILLESPEKGQDHLHSIINICISSFTSKTDSQPGTGKLALEIVGGMPKMFETRRLLQFVPQLERELTLACGHGVRELRKLARLARQAWAPLK